MSDQAATARRLLNHENVGVLSTHSADIEGYPFGSIAPYTLNYEGEPIILISDIAQHTRNIKQNNKVSLTVFDRRSQDPQAGSRLTWVGEAEAVDPKDSATRARYLRYFPAAESYFETHDFSFYRIRLQRARFIGGFGQIFWIEPIDMLITNPFSATENGIVEHMNHDHKKALAHYSMLMGANVGPMTMAGIDREGFDLLIGNEKYRMEFELQINTVDEARAVLIELAKRE